jgi:hypothetical protein
MFVFESVLPVGHLSNLETDDLKLSVCGNVTQPTKELTEGGDLRFAQVSALGLYSHSCLDGIAGSVTDI